MKRYMKIDCGVSMLQPLTILTVGQILKNYLTNGEIPQATNSRPYDFEAEMDEKGFSHAKGFDGVYARDLHPDLFKAVSRESRESARKKAALSQDQGSSIKDAAETAETVSATAGAGE